MLIGKRLFFTLLAFFMFQSQLSAAEDESDLVNTSLISTTAISKDDILKSLEMLKKNGQISQSDFDQAKKDLMKMSDAEVNGIKDKAVDMVAKDPKKAMEIVKKK